MNHYIVKYDTLKYPFRGTLMDTIGAYCFEGLHSIFPEEVVTDPAEYEANYGKKLQESKLHQAFYNNKDNFLPLYQKFVKEVIKPIYEKFGEFYYQAIPTFRIHYHGSIAVGADHKDKDFGHSPYEINIFLPFTDTWKENSIWLEEEPINLNYGEFAIFDGANKLHGNKVNITNFTRVSVDFRILPKIHYTGEDQTLTTKTKFRLGEYWNEL